MRFQEIKKIEFDKNGLVRFFTNQGVEDQGHRIITHANHIEVFNKGDEAQLKAFLGQKDQELIEFITKKWSEL